MSGLLFLVLPGCKMVAASDRPEFTLDEINEEIRLAREEMAAREKATL